MRYLRAASIALAFVAATGLIFGTVGFAAMNADRGLSVSLTDDESAFLGYGTLTDTVHDGESTPVVEYQNQFKYGLDEFHVDVSIVGPDDTEATLVGAKTSDELPSATNGTVDITLACPVEEAVYLLFEATGSGAGVSVSLDRVHTVTCVPSDDGDDPGDGPIVTGIHYDDAANADIATDGPDGHVTAIVWIVDNPSVDTPDAIEAVAFEGDDRLDTSKGVRPEVVQNRAPSDLPSGWKIVAIEFPEQGVAYVHPEWNAGEYTTPKTGDGVAVTDLPLDADALFHASVEDGEVVGGGDAEVVVDGDAEVVGGGDAEVVGGGDAEVVGGGDAEVVGGGDGESSGTLLDGIGGS